MKQIIRWTSIVAWFFCGMLVFAQEQGPSQAEIAAATPAPTRTVTHTPTRTATHTPTRTATRTPRPTPTAVVRHTTIEAASFNFIAGVPDYTVDGLVGGNSNIPPATGVANVQLGDGTVVTAFTVCGRDDASDEEFSGTLKRKTINPLNSAFTVPEVMATVHSGVTSASNAMQCLTAPITRGTAIIDNSQFTYFVEIDVGFTTEVIAATVDH